MRKGESLTSVRQCRRRAMVRMRLSSGTRWGDLRAGWGLGDGSLGCGEMTAYSGLDCQADTWVCSSPCHTE